ncbi:hypothetical protein NL676_023530 [Syzygium grande]|nr:hypothetical protein NL676_023530 [Syzygium grande]
MKDRNGGLREAEGAGRRRPRMVGHDRWQFKTRGTTEDSRFRLPRGVNKKQKKKPKKEKKGVQGKREELVGGREEGGFGAPASRFTLATGEEQQGRRRKGREGKEGRRRACESMGEALIFGPPFGGKT